MRRVHLRSALPLLLVAACAAKPTPPKPPPADRHAWTTTLDADHPLVGRIWNVRTSRFVHQRDALAPLDGFVLLGEKHDNPDHHALQALVLRDLVARGKKPAVAFEQLDLEKQPAVDEARATRRADAVATAAAWESSGWPPFAQYAPIVQAALDADLPIFATGLSRTRMRSLMKPEDGAPPLDEGEPLTEEHQASLAEELREGHCGKLPEAMLPVMIRVQRARDASMANALAKAPGGVLVAGTGHVRRDRGAGRDLAARAPGKPVWSVAFVEVERGKDDPLAYAARWHAKTLPFDLVWFTPRANDDDPCAAFTPKKGDGR